MNTQGTTKRIAILGSSGSIGVNTLRVVEHCPERFEVVGLSVQRNITLLEEQMRRFRPRLVSVADERSADRLRQRCADMDIEIVSGDAGAVAVATHPSVDLVLSAIVGVAGLRPTYEAIRANKHIALANKETLVVAGALIMPEIARRGLALLPVDSEHNAIFQALQGHRKDDMHKIVLTASGGPFRGCSAEQLHHVTLADALQHPNWIMGQKITIDSATLMNKGLEVLEAHWLFDTAFDRIQVVVHPQSIIHSLVEYIDGSLIAQLGNPDMRIPIAYALTYPERIVTDVPRLDLTTAGQFTFEQPDFETFPCLPYAYQAGEVGGTMPAVLNAANEVAVAAFLREEIRFVEIPQIIHRVMEAHAVRPLTSLDEAFEADRWAREHGTQLITSKK